MGENQCQDGQKKGVQIGKTVAVAGGINPKKMTALTVIGDKIRNWDGQELGKIEDVVLDLTCGTVSYLVLSVGGLAGIGDKFFAVPLDALTIDTRDIAFYMEADKKQLKQLAGFDKNDWPEKAQWPLGSHDKPK